MRLMLALVLAAGCGRLGFGPLDQRDSGADDDGDVDAPGSGTDDPDGDGRPNATDNCPAVSNVDQHDEDLDGRGDPCDKCPPVAETVEVDPDNDGVSASCDPSPATPGDRILVFEGFGAGIPTGWVKNGTWMTAVPDTVNADVGSGVAAAITLPIVPDRTSAMTARVTPISVNAGVSTWRGVGMSGYHGLGFNDGAACMLFLPLGTSVRVGGTIDLSNNSIIDSSANSWADGTPVVISDTRTTNTVVCLTPPSNVTSSAGSQGTPRASVFTTSISARYDWVMFVDSP